MREKMFLTQQHITAKAIATEHHLQHYCAAIARFQLIQVLEDERTRGRDPEEER
jgi:hypothetical protein